MGDQHIEQHDGFAVIDKRAIKRDDAIKRKNGQLQFTQQAAGALFWEAEYAASNGRPDIAELTLAKRAELLDGARHHLGAVGEKALAKLTA